MATKKKAVDEVVIDEKATNTTKIPKKKKTEKVEEVVETKVEDTVDTVEEDEEAVEAVEETPIVEIKEEVEEPVVEVVKPTETKKAMSNVRVKARVNHNCFIGGTRYVLTAGQCYNVPPEVKDILNRAGVLAPL